ncbi:DUF3307 domain-containing protein [Kineosporia sp. NBRC 101731]|uniref:DUF3307 domain-containing protein n=1 Tax=Kineosporia sp. NBRC 101731 TaxID=3032199 RepID=UPI0024A3CD39|nr:DUF3307 domain-containing protein [Kineosporia sp. NBRC 101731]GLY32074.1 hypothetical protein Kisp02_54390 [Kineosporia sp. NBRC 101731]
MNAAIVFPVILLSWFVGHHVGDHLIQTDRQAREKGGAHGHGACLSHVATLTVTKLVLLAEAFTALDLWGTTTTWALLAGVALDAVTHYWADRRHTLATFSELTAKGNFYRLAPPLGGAHLIDQSWHLAWLFVAALIAATGSFALLATAAAAFAAIAATVYLSQKETV